MAGWSERVADESNRRLGWEGHWKSGLGRRVQGAETVWWRAADMRAGLEVVPDEKEERNLTR